MSPRSGRGLGEGFGRLLGANLTSSLADGIARTAAPLLALRLSDDPLLIAGVAAVIMVPWLLFALPSGMLVDRFDRRRILALASGSRAALGVLLLVLTATGWLSIWWLYGILFVYGIGETLADGAIRAIVPSVVGPSDLARANGRIEAGEQVLQGFVAAPLTSALFAVSALIPLGMDAAAFAIAAGLALALPRRASGRTAHVPTQSLGVQLRAGWRFLVADRMLWMLWMFSTFFGFSLTVASSLVPFVAVDSFGLPEGLFGLLLLFEALGGVLAAAVVDRIRRRFGTGRTMAAAAVLGSLAFLLPWAVPQVWALALGLFVYSAGLVIWNVLIISLRQAAIPTELLGRVHGTWRTLHWGALPLGALVGGLIGRIDPTLPFLVGGGAAAAGALLLSGRLRRLPEPEDL
ncbi:MFS transporter [Microbacterium sp. W4I20]|uniref:MFS transporter n=1 Tax=Microbacterium sp. W4I20 TaxID=3042262 RepID=UPI002781C90C|nr:MFS transporter [Microbacterium sp. W4I20]MDQ0729195.1 MFS family permease [Microbacterium sp. W4I20]